MSTGSIGTLGTDDDQEQTAWDDTALWWSAAAQVTGGISVPAIDCSRWGYTHIAARVAAFRGKLTLTWTSAKTGGVVLGVRTIMLDPNTANSTQLVVPNMGPWVSGTFAPASGASVWTPTINALFTNRARPAEAYPVATSLVDANGVTLTAGGSAVFWFTDVFAGPCALLVNSGNTGVEIIVNSVSPAYGTSAVYDKTFAASAITNDTVVVPLCSCWVTVLNSSATVANTGMRVILTPNLAAI